MYRSLLSVLLLGMVPASAVPLPPPENLQRIAIAAPAAGVIPDARLSASGVLVMDALSGQQVFARNADVPRPMASLTKLMTALIIVENHDLSDVVAIPWGAENVVGTKAYLKPGERYTVGDLLSAMLLPSANDAAIALAIFHSGSVQDFVDAMNARASVLGLKHTSYANPIGLDSDTQWSTPRDIAWLTQAVLRQPALAKRMGMKGTQIRSLEGTVIPLTHSHNLLHQALPLTGGKTGTTGLAGECLVSLVEEGGRQYIVVLLHSAERYQDLRTILAALSPEPAAVAASVSEEALSGSGSTVSP